MTSLITQYFIEIAEIIYNLYEFNTIFQVTKYNNKNNLVFCNQNKL